MLYFHISIYVSFCEIYFDVLYTSVKHERMCNILF